MMTPIAPAASAATPVHEGAEPALDDGDRVGRQHAVVDRDAAQVLVTVAAGCRAGLSVITLRVPVTGRPGQSFSLMPLRSAPVVRSIVAPGKLWMMSDAATARMPVALPGAPVMNALGPSLPAEATTTTPDATSVLLAWASRCRCRRRRRWTC
jgi:hypothetical protein